MLITNLTKLLGALLLVKGTTILFHHSVYYLS